MHLSLAAANSFVSYMESIEILYSTNTINIRSLALMRHLDVLFLPQRLACITSLELTWTILPFPSIRDSQLLERPGEGLKTFQSMIRLITPKNYPSLRKLFLTLSNFFDDANGPPPWPGFLANSALLVESVDTMVRQFNGQLQECVLGVPSATYRRLGWLNDDDTTVEAGVFWERFWRRVPCPRNEVNTDHPQDQTLGFWFQTSLLEETEYWPSIYAFTHSQYEFYRVGLC